MALRSPKQLAPRNAALPASEAPELARAVEENLRDIQGQVALLPLFFFRTFNYRSQPSQSTMSVLTNTERPPLAVILVRAIERQGADATTFLETPTNWAWSNGTVSFLEPPSMSADTDYTLTFLIIGDN